MSAPTQRLTHGGLFEGFGGTTMAAEAVLGPLDTRWVSDIKPASVALLAHHHPEAPNFGDLMAAFPAVGPLPATTAGIEPVDVLTTSWPCQPESLAGKRLGMLDPRALWPNVARVIAERRPRIVLGENVASIIRNGALDRAVADLEALGYVTAWVKRNASDDGAPHRRARCFLVAVRADSLGLLADLVSAPDVEQVAGDVVTLLPTPTQNMTTGPGRQGRAGGMNLQTAAVTLLPTPTARDMKDRGNFTEKADRRRSLPHRIRAMEVAAQNPKLLPTPRESDGPKGGPGMRGSSGDRMMPSWAVDHASSWGEYTAAIARWETILGRPAPAPTQHSHSWLKMIARRRSGGDPRPAGYRGSLAPRPQLAPRFVEWMMGLPEGWVTDVPTIAAKPSGLRNAALSLLGDGVVPQQGASAYAAGFAELLAAQEQDTA